ncbi:hypothetical protein CDAR_312901 [Caerostris darwini]|uniref:Uncharacterized protein n=1 Tax=Caerostris darwini TaxID=1538125 RepID=A0AAV4S072_9ARAC|nr:hypothetical protein CDAR_312901 [Caerostris darwini]
MGLSLPKPISHPNFCLLAHKCLRASQTEDGVEDSHQISGPPIRDRRTNLLNPCPYGCAVLIYWSTRPLLSLGGLIVPSECFGKFGAVGEEQ